MKVTYTYKDGSEGARDKDEDSLRDYGVKLGSNRPMMISIWGRPTAEFIDWASNVMLPTHLGGIGVLVNGEIVGGELLDDDPIFG